MVTIDSKDRVPVRYLQWSAGMSRRDVVAVLTGLGVPVESAEDGSLFASRSAFGDALRRAAGGSA